jgi:2,4-dienoyl-CoA reductase-like NADH-dependent reductase (Old Yellow Enzyme family)
MEVGMQKNLKLSTILKEKGVDLIDVSSGALVYQQIPVAPNYQVPLLNKLKKKAES